MLEVTFYAVAFVNCSLYNSIYDTNNATLSIHYANVIHRADERKYEMMDVSPVNLQSRRKTLEQYEQQGINPAAHFHNGMIYEENSY
uniref:Secreted protein n=1 Tax=Heterorhabditis bacteriophora TaxID=37862 RepID=A0A1I7XN52_HETBA